MTVPRTDSENTKIEITLDQAIDNALTAIGKRDGYPNTFYPQSAGRMLPLLKDVQETPPGRLVDIGCGVGFMSSVISQFGFEVHCLEVFRHIEEKVIRRFGLRYLEASIELPPVPYEDNFFDIAILTEVIEHFNYNPLIPLKEIYRILKPDGLLFLTTPNIASLFSIYTFLRGDNVNLPIEIVMREGWQQVEVQNRTFRDMHFRYYTAKEISYLLKLAGFSIVKNQSLVRGQPSTRNLPKKLFLYLAKGIVALTNSRLWGDTIYVVAKKPH